MGFARSLRVATAINFHQVAENVHRYLGRELQLVTNEKEIDTDYHRMDRTTRSECIFIEMRVIVFSLNLNANAHGWVVGEAECVLDYCHVALTILT